MTARAPKGLAAAGGRLWRTVLDAYELSPAELLLLERAARTADRLARLDDLIGKTSPLVRGSVGQMRRSPLWEEVAEQERILIMQIRHLALPDPEQISAAQSAWRDRRRSGRIA